MRCEGVTFNSSNAGAVVMRTYQAMHVKTSLSQLVLQFM